MTRRVARGPLVEREVAEEGGLTVALATIITPSPRSPDEHVL